MATMKEHFAEMHKRHSDSANAQADCHEGLAECMKTLGVKRQLAITPWRPPIYGNSLDITPRKRKC